MVDTARHPGAEPGGGAYPPAPGEARAGWWESGGWYLPFTILTLGLLAWVPFLHAGDRLRSARVRWAALAYAVVEAALLACVLAAPTDAAGNVIGVGNVLMTVGFLGGIVLIAVACTQQWLLHRRLVTAAGTRISPDEAAIARALAARAKRTRARALAESDPLLAHELGIGRPDLPTAYDDGGLVDLNSAPAGAIARMCGLPFDTAGKIVTARTVQAHGFASVDEMLVLVDVPVSAWERVRDRAIAVPD